MSTLKMRKEDVLVADPPPLAVRVGPVVGGWGPAEFAALAAMQTYGVFVWTVALAGLLGWRDAIAFPRFALPGPTSAWFGESTRNKSKHG